MSFNFNCLCILDKTIEFSKIILNHIKIYIWIVQGSF